MAVRSAIHIARGAKAIATTSVSKLMASTSRPRQAKRMPSASEPQFAVILGAEHVEIGHLAVSVTALDGGSFQ